MYYSLHKIAQIHESTVDYLSSYKNLWLLSYVQLLMHPSHV